MLEFVKSNFSKNEKLSLSPKVHNLKTISPQNLKERLQKGDSLFLLDVREPYERELGAIPSEHIPMGEICDRISEIPSNDELVVICRSGKRAEAVSNLLKTEFKLENVCILEGGLLAWKETIDSELKLD
jgi:adenylyltransferase/sulfurtransferase